MEKIKDRIRKLLAQAEDQHGTPEGDAFYDKAFALIAQYGIDQSDIGPEDSGITMREFQVVGSYSAMQAGLLLNIAEALHCTGFNRGPRATRINSVMVFGRPCHLERVDLLYSVLRLSMLSGAMRIHATHGVIQARRSYMLGFAHRIGERLGAAEATAASGEPGYGIALIDDAHSAYLAQTAYLSHNNLSLSEVRSRGGFHRGAYSQGVDAGSGVDIGQQKVSGLRALGGEARTPGDR